MHPTGPSILLTDPMHPDALARLRECYTVDEALDLTKTALIERVGSYSVIIGRTSTKLDKEVLEAATSLKAIGVHATGWDHIDIEEATSRGVRVLGFPTDTEAFADDTLRGSFIPVAEHVLMGMLMLAKRALESTASIKEGRWDKYRLMGTELYGKTLGIVGLGRIGSLIATRARAFGMDVIAAHPRLTKDEAMARGAWLVPFEELLGRSDFITVHVPRRHDTIGLIGRGEFTRMKDGVVIVNTSRAGIVDEEALLAALDKNVRGAVIDVFGHPPEGVNWELAKHPRVVATPHIAGVTEESLERVSSHIVESVLRFLDTGEVRGLINPEVLSV